MSALYESVDAVRAGRMKVITSIDDLKVIYRRRVPKMFYDYVQSGSWTESTLQDNQFDFAQIKLRQKVGIDVSSRTTACTLLGEEASMPVALSPVGMAGLQNADGEIKAARAAERFGVPFTLSTMSINSMEEVADKTDKPFWFQLYAMRDQEFMNRLIERARECRCSALVVTMDLPVIGQQHQNLKNNMAVPSAWTLSTIWQFVLNWPWAIDMLPARRRRFGNLAGHVKGANDNASLRAWIGSQFDGSLDWGKLRLLRMAWRGPLILKGIMNVEDANKALSIGADAIVVSNHGGRQLDGSVSSIKVLPAILDAVGNKMEVHVDSGVRSGQDIFRALALGADAAHIGRAYIYGLGALGEAGVTKALEILHKELDLSMALCGVTAAENLCRENIGLPADSLGIPKTESFHGSTIGETS